MIVYVLFKKKINLSVLIIMAILLKISNINQIIKILSKINQKSLKIPLIHLY